MESHALHFPEKRGQVLAIMIFDRRGIPREIRYTHPDAEDLTFDELRERVKLSDLAELRQRADECLQNGRDTTTDGDARSLQCQAVLLRTDRVLYGVIVVAGYGSKNGVLAQFGRDYFFGQKNRPHKEDVHGKA